MPIISEPVLEHRAYHSLRQFARLQDEAAALVAPPSPEDFYFYVEQFAIHGMHEPFAKLRVVSKPAMAKSSALTKYYLNYKALLDRNETVLGADYPTRLNHELLGDAPHLVQRGEAPTKRLVIVVPTYYNNAMVGFPILDAHLERLGVDTLYLKATQSQISYYNGFFGFGSNADAVAKCIEKLCEKHGYESVSLLGASSGGFMALWLGAKLKAARVCVFGSDTKPTMRSKLLSAPNLARMTKEDEITELADLSQIEQIFAYAGSQRSRDVECLTLLEGLPNVVGRMIPGVSHMVLTQLLIMGYDLRDLVE